MQPERIGRYQILREVGRGAMGVVYLAHDPALERRVAIKTVTIGDGLQPREQKEARLRFLREAQAAGKLIHPNIVLVFDVGEYEQGKLFISMELIEGPTLDAFTHPPDQLPHDKVRDLIAQACDALDFAHGQSLIHRDIKPANLMVVGGERLKVTDFGLAKDPTTNLTHTGTLVGTPNYMSPEQITGKKLDGRTDLFSLGVVLYELLTGEKPFHGDSISAVIYRILNEEPTGPRTVNRGLPERFDAILRKALEKEPEARFQSGQEMARALRGETTVLARVGSDAADQTQVSRTRSAAKPEPRAAAPSVPPAPVRTRGGRAKTLVLSLVAIAVTVLAMGAFFPQPTARGVARLAGFLPPEAGGEYIVGLVESSGLLEGGNGANAVIALSANRPGARFLLNGRPLEGNTLAWSETIQGSVVTGFDECGRGEEVLEDGIAPASGSLEIRLTEPAIRRIAVRSEPAGAEVSVDGEKLGSSTPVDLELEACARHDVSLTLPGYRAEQIELPAEGGWEARIGETVSLEPLPDGRLRVKSPYRLIVFDGDQRLGSSDSPLALPPGTHRLTLRNHKYRVNVRESVEIVSNEEQVLQAKVPRLGRVRVNAYPGNAVILVDGIQVGPPPADLTLGRGEHVFSCRWNVGGSADAERTVMVRAGDANPPVNFKRGS